MVTAGSSRHLEIPRSVAMVLQPASSKGIIFSSLVLEALLHNSIDSESHAPVRVWGAWNQKEAEHKTKTANTNVN